MKYKVGDKVRIKSLDWYNQNKDEFGEVKCGGYVFPYPMTKHCGKTVTIRCINTKDCYYVIYEDDGYRSWTDEMIECLVEPVTLNESSKMVSLNKVCEYLGEELFTSFDFFGNVETTSKDSINKKEFIEKLRKAMEE